MEIDFRNIQPVVNGMGIDECLDNLWMEIGDVRQLNIPNRLSHSDWADDSKLPLLITDLCLEEEYLHFVCKYILNIDLLPFQCAILRMLWNKQLPMLIASRGAGKSWLLSVYVILRLLLHQGCRIAVVGAGLRQSMVLFTYISQIYEEAPVLQDIVGSTSKKSNAPKRDINMCYWNVGNSRVVFLPLGNGDKIRGQRANIIIADEFGSISNDVFETVVRGFAAVKSEGVHRNVAQAYRSELMRHLNNDEMKQLETLEDNIKIRGSLSGNQIVIAGTAYYQFNHFYQYYSYYRSIILSGGDIDLLKKEFPDRTIESTVDPSQYCIFRLPYDAVPIGIMDKTILEQGRATMDPMIFDMEYGAVFPSDSEGFYLASWLHNATVPMEGDNLTFTARLMGDPNKEYVMGIDPASESDNFAINILEINDDNIRHCIYQWSTNRKDFEELKRRGLISDTINDYNTYCIKHIRDLRRRFHIKLIVMDTGGGGIAIREGLKDHDKLLDDYDDLILDMDDDNVNPDDGSKILKMIEFSNYNWRRNAHWGLRNDILNKKILFPAYDVSEIELHTFLDNKQCDTLEDCYLEIEQCKREITLIRHEQTPNGNERWDVPRVIGLDADQVKKRIKKDRFTSILLSNWGCRLLSEDRDEFTPNEYEVFGGSPQDFSGGAHSSKAYFGKGANKLPNNYVVGPLGKTISNNGRTIYF